MSHDGSQQTPSLEALWGWGLGRIEFGIHSMQWKNIDESKENSTEVIFAQEYDNRESTGVC